MRPDPTLGASRDDAERAELAAAKSAMGPEGVECAVRETMELRKIQETADPPEVLAAVPTLALSDMPRKGREVETERAFVGLGAPLLRHEMHTAGITYVDLALDVSAVDADDVCLLPLFARMLKEAGLEGGRGDAVQLSRRIGKHTGGVSGSLSHGSRFGKPAQPQASLILRGKCVSGAGKEAELASVMRDMLLHADLSNRERFVQLSREALVAAERAAVSSGHMMCASRLASCSDGSVAGWLSDQLGGVARLASLRELTETLVGQKGSAADEAWASVQARLERLRDTVVAQPNAVLAVTADSAGMSAADPALSALIGALPTEGWRNGSARAWGPRSPVPGPIAELYTAPTQVNYVGKGGNLYDDAGYALHGSAMVVSKLLGTTHLWDKVRVVGGAYGGFCTFDFRSGDFRYLSYRDPNLSETLDAYDSTASFLRDELLAPGGGARDALDKAIIATIGDIDGHQLPDARGHTATLRFLLGETAEERQRRREEILATTEEDVLRFADALDAIAKHGHVVAVCSEEAAGRVCKEGHGGRAFEVAKLI
jgi:Zn-dependent M16 (insulinase) family peptidase